MLKPHAPPTLHPAPPLVFPEVSTSVSLKRLCSGNSLIFPQTELWAQPMASRPATEGHRLHSASSSVPTRS